MSATAPPDPMGRNTIVRWFILALILVASFIAYVLRSNMSIVGPTIMNDIGFSEMQLGMVLSAFSLSYAIFQIPSGVFGGRLGSRVAVAAIAIVWGAITIAFGLIPGSGVASVGVVVACLVVLRFLMGVAQAPIFPVTGATTADWFPIGQWGLPLGLSSTGLTLGAAATALGTGVDLHTVGNDPSKGEPVPLEATITELAAGGTNLIASLNSSRTRLVIAS